MFPGERIRNEAGKGTATTMLIALAAGGLLAQSGIADGLTDGPSGKLTVHARMTDQQVERRIHCHLQPDTTPSTTNYGATPSQIRCAQKAANIIIDNSFPTWNGADKRALKELWHRESNWSAKADNPTSTAYGIPQALVGTTERNLPPRTRFRTGQASYDNSVKAQIDWGLLYIESRYGDPTAALAFHKRKGWY